ncbi:unnamed protein product [Didymodactylos carnosus]|uniref:AIG1-type G domain-containing protein n=1 Tax=Didymodactylos carnosus TaxID=1234261 RepID=A0A813QKJ8_9BILA|nr:unnamed protein product [Didymodactylos carnosus]CAF3551517.1 unnamed protein product [Didymodactylos carnosus]
MSKFAQNAERVDQNIINTSNQHGLIILGNSGVGKSFLANILLGREAFVHKFSSTSVTHSTEFEEIQIGYHPLAIFNIPGLIEAEQERIDLNKKEIDKAFAQRPNSIVMYVFGQQGGRIREEDVVAFNAINAAYPFRSKSLVLVVNGIPKKKRESDYEGTTLVLLQQLLKGVDVNNRNLCFLDFIDEDDQSEKQRIKEQLLQTVVEFTPSKHEKRQEIEIIIDQLKQAKQLIKEQQAKFEAERDRYMEQIGYSQDLLNETLANQKSEKESFERAIQRQEEMYAEQKRRFEEECKRFENELQNARKDADHSQRLYDLISKDREATQQQIRAVQEANNQLQAKLIEIASRPPPEPRIIYEDDDSSLCVIS